MNGMMKRNLILILLLIVAMSFSVGCNTKPMVQADINAPTYMVVKAGETVSLKSITAQDKDGNKCPVNITVVDKDGQTVVVNDDGFLATSVGEYKVSVQGGENVKAEKVEFVVYSTSDGREYSIALPQDMPTVAEWGKECIIPIAKAMHIVDGEVLANVEVVDENGTKCDFDFDRFVPTTLGKYTVTYSYGGAKASAVINCQDTLAPVVFLRNSATVKPSYGENFLLPYVAVIDAQEDVEKRVVTVYREDDKDDILYQSELPYEDKSVRITIDASKYFTYSIYAEDMGGRSSTTEFVIKRAEHYDIDQFDLKFEGTTLTWEDRSLLTEKYLGYKNVAGYELSLDGGNTFIQTLDATTTQFKVESKEFCRVVVKELSANDRESAISTIAYFDGSLKEGVLADFEDVGYEGIISMGSYAYGSSDTQKGYRWNYENAFSKQYSPDGYEGEAGGVLKLHNDIPCSFKLTFPKQTDIIQENSFLIIRLYFEKYQYGDMYINPYGTADTFSTYDAIKDYGLIDDAVWQTLVIPVSDLSNKVGGYLDGLEIKFAGMLVLGDIKMQTLTADTQNNQLMSFDTLPYKGLVSVGANFYFNSSHHTTYEIVEDGYNGVDSGVLKITNVEPYTALKLKFYEKLTVTEKTYLRIKMYSSGKEVNVAKYDAGQMKENGWDSYNENGTFLKDYGLLGNKWETVYLPLVDAQIASVGEEIEGIQIVMRDTNIPSTVYIDEISYIDLDMVQALGEGQLADYNYIPYVGEVGVGENFYFNSTHHTVYEILEDGYGNSGSGVLKITNMVAYTALQLDFLKPVTVNANTHIVLKIYSGVSQLSVADYNAGQLHENGYESTNYTGTDIQRYGLKLNEWSTVKIPLVDIGLANIGDVIEDGIQIVMLSTELPNSIYIDEIRVEDITADTLVIGDSYASKKYYTNCEQELASVDGYNIGIGGTTIEEWYSVSGEQTVNRIPDILSYQPKNVVIHLGVNDINRGQSGDSTAQELVEFVKALKVADPNLKIFYVTICKNLNYEHKWTEYEENNQAVKDALEQEENVYVIDFYAKQVENENVWQNKGFIAGDVTHLTAEAYQALSEMIISAIASA